jgi:hypothetical protein
MSYVEIVRARRRRRRMVAAALSLATVVAREDGDED